MGLSGYYGRFSYENMANVTYSRIDPSDTGQDESGHGLHYTNFHIKVHGKRCRAFALPGWTEEDCVSSQMYLVPIDMPQLPYSHVLVYWDDDIENYVPALDEDGFYVYYRNHPEGFFAKVYDPYLLVKDTYGDMVHLPEAKYGRGNMMPNIVEDDTEE